MSKNLLPELDSDDKKYEIIIIEVSKELCVDYRSRDWCKFEYPGHKNGCPNYGVLSHTHCPPHCPKIEDFVDLTKQTWMVICKFNLGMHVETMKEKHPDWSDKQLYCCLYWQGTARKELNKALKTFVTSKFDSSELTYTLLPEAMGVNVFKTLRRKDIEIERNPKKYVLKVALVGYKLKT